MENDFQALSIQAEALLKDEDKLERILQRLEKKLKTLPVVGTELSYIPLMISLVRQYVKKEYPDIPIASIIMIIVALLYFLSPVDIIPDVIPGVGYIDDGAVVVGCLHFIRTDIEEYKVWREKNGYVIEDLVDYEEIEKEAASKNKLIDAFFKGRKSKK